uniref:EF-hand domain-containing protein n=1 Tax=Pyramimonas obovata TaxID=1411642 RepID=A0A7S0WST5_9CHLO|mmetsp:Transcript_38350/g.83424  ORF Transcript_38350/g.83424 Transcript_38350/m.83424 type:complete len:283 (+) Transcript_38350:327-1175(+)|eukprot:CAMPEP_0118933868 /NCGR_PEP_ID=MMETSP1169-20130426/12756_1 /TAXON_ID=36882 /ORGANISM="Pyramimonas obovata, Strain CCMP722" /LENGTH=282 /DNA_ID=CAMNT_0006876691 /DNA_START=324 /DNA_END=1172 /DNA_ORIENTATION=+
MGNCFGSKSQGQEQKNDVQSPPKPSGISSGGLSLFGGSSQSDKNKGRSPLPDKPKPRRRRSSITESFSVRNEYVIKLLHDCLQRHRARGVMKSLNSILMKFSKVEEGLSSARKAFKELEKPGTNTVCASELETACEKIGLDLSGDAISALKIDPNDTMNFKEFVVALSLVYMVKPETESPLEDPGKPARKPTEFEQAIDIVVDSFNFFDSNADGILEKPEVLNTFNTASARNKDGRGNISAKRFEEMDWDQDEKITFPEFLHAYETWIGIEDDDEEDNFKFS